MKVSQVDPRWLLYGAALAAVAYLAWKATGAAGRALDSAKQAIDQGIADVTQAWNNTFTTQLPERTEKTYLYSDEAYTGVDPVTGQAANEGARADEEFRRYEADYRAAEAEFARVRSTTTTEGAAFGIYPSAGKRAQP